MGEGEGLEGREGGWYGVEEGTGEAGVVLCGGRGEGEKRRGGRGGGGRGWRQERGRGLGVVRYFIEKFHMTRFLSSLKIEIRFLYFYVPRTQKLRFAQSGLTTQTRYQRFSL